MNCRRSTGTPYHKSYYPYRPRAKSTEVREHWMVGSVSWETKGVCVYGTLVVVPKLCSVLYSTSYVRSASFFTIIIASFPPLAPRLLRRQAFFGYFRPDLKVYVNKLGHF